ncbi:TetR/AcrR family transcriptional regulator [Ottowia testudinis]|uniref:TetR/AcrR family transcriptional regulator n=1 Tax=Ottowia testudinis TaxID=2816950 RepID=A0A975CFF7_9BURK|nr:TetR/AcrR family transcriptional regulator [Ottowia testudinis]QTD44817.1 TetR/AcrR family transcriptional regulator [Ottowia testudinis]
MVRPSRQIDEALLASGAALYPRLGCAGLSVRAVAAHAGVAPGMFHYHFESKQDFLRQLLQRFYEDLFSQLEVPTAQPGAPLDRLHAALCAMARFLRQHAAELRRVLADAEAGEAVARDFLRRNMPRHLRLLLGLLAEAEAAGQIGAQPPLLRMTFVLGAVVAPVLVGSVVQQAGFLPAPARAQVAPQVLSDEAIALRAELALRALAAKGPA